jgi:hypothetical protein
MIHISYLRKLPFGKNSIYKEFFMQNDKTNTKFTPY